MERRSLKKKNQGFNGIRTRDLRDTGAMLYQLSYEATHWERGQFIEFISSRDWWLICYQLSWLYLITLLYSPNSTAPQFLKKLTPFLLVCPSWLDAQHNVLYGNAFTVLLKWARSLVKILNNFYLFMAYNQQILQRNTWSYCSIWCNKCWYICQCEKMAAWNWSKLWRCPENFGWVKSHYI